MATSSTYPAILVDVTKDDVDAALLYRVEHKGMDWTQSAVQCPIFQALTRMGYLNVRCSGPSEIYINRNGYPVRYRVSTSGSKIMEDYDNGNHVDPAGVYLYPWYASVSETGEGEETP